MYFCLTHLIMFNFANLIIPHFSDDEEDKTEVSVNMWYCQISVVILPVTNSPQVKDRVAISSYFRLVWYMYGLSGH